MKFITDRGNTRPVFERPTRVIAKCKAIDSNSIVLTEFAKCDIVEDNTKQIVVEYVKFLRGVPRIVQQILPRIGIVSIRPFIAVAH